MAVEIINGGMEIPIGRSCCDPVHVFSWNKGRILKIYWRVPKQVAIEKFQLFAENYDEPIEQASLWYGEVEQELLVDTTWGEAAKDVIAECERMLIQSLQD